jgi:serine/threonine protein kinase
MKMDKLPKDPQAFFWNAVNEATIMKQMDHERIVKFIGFDLKHLSIIMEMMPRGSLSSFIKKNKKTLRWSERYQMMLDVCKGMTFLHSNIYFDKTTKQVLFHQDLKNANVLLPAEGGINRGEIGDLGLSCMFLSFFKFIQVLTQIDELETSGSKDVQLNDGTRCYQAPVSTSSSYLFRNCSFTMPSSQKRQTSLRMELSSSSWLHSVPQQHSSKFYGHVYCWCIFLHRWSRY